MSSKSLYNQYYVRYSLFSSYCTWKYFTILKVKLHLEADLLVLLEIQLMSKQFCEATKDIEYDSFEELEANIDFFINKKLSEL